MSEYKYVIGELEDMGFKVVCIGCNEQADELIAQVAMSSTLPRTKATVEMPATTMRIRLRDWGSEAG